MSVDAFLSQLEAMGVRLSANDDKLHCRAPEGVMDAALRARLREHKSEILQILHTRKTVALGIPRAQRDNGVLSSTERRYRTLEMMSSGHGAYNMALPYRIRGALQPNTLRDSIHHVVRRHRILHSRYPTTGSGPARIQDAPLPDLEEIELRDNPESRQEHMDRILWEPFDLETGPLLRFALLREAEQQYTLLLAFHHLVFDGASFRIFCAELAQCYQRLCSGQPIDLPELPVEYSDYAQWEKEWMQGQWLEQKLVFWKGHLEPLPPALQLGRQPIATRAPRRRGARVDFLVSPTVLTAARELARSRAATLHMLMLGVFDILLWQMSGSRDFIVGLPVSNRDHPELEHVVGNFTNTLALRQSLDDQQNFTELLDRVRESCLEGYQHRELPLEQLAAQLNLAQGTRGSNLFSVMFDLQDTSLSAFDLPGLETTALRTEKGDTTLDLSLVLVPEGETVRATLEYDCNRFERDDIEAAASAFKALLATVVASQQQPLCELPPLIAPLAMADSDGTTGEASEGRAFVPARTNLELHLVKLWEDLLGCEDIGIRDNFFDRGGQSLTALRLTQRVEEMTGQQLSIDFLWLEEPTIERLAERLCAGDTPVDWRRPVSIQPLGDRNPLWVVHTAAGHLYRYYCFARGLHPAQPVYGLNARGVYGNENPRSDIELIAKDCIESMRSLQPSGPYHIAGECMAGTTAYEMARQLTDQGERVGMVGLLESYARGVPARRSLRAFVYELRGYENLRTVQEAIYHWGLTRLGLAHRRELRKISEAQRWAHWGYKPGSYCGRVDIYAAAASQRACGDETLCWGQVQGINLQVHSMPGDHATMMEPPHVETVAAAVQSRLDELEGRGSSSSEDRYPPDRG